MTKKLLVLAAALGGLYATYGEELSLRDVLSWAPLPARHAAASTIGEAELARILELEDQIAAESRTIDDVRAGRATAAAQPLLAVERYRALYASYSREVDRYNAADRAPGLPVHGRVSARRDIH